MRSLNKNSRHQASGFSLLEMVIVLAITITMVSISFVSLGPVMKDQHLTNAFNTTLAAMRLARGNAVAQRTSYSVTFANAVSPSPYATITVAPTVAGFQGDQNAVIYHIAVGRVVSGACRDFPRPPRRFQMAMDRGRRPSILGGR